MKVHFSYFRILLTLLIILAVALPASAAKDEFDRSDGALGGNWSSHSDMVIKSGRLHNQSSTTGWNSFLSVYNVVNANEVTIYWPASGSGISGNGAELGGVAFVNSFSAGADGYLVYIYSSELRLYRLAAGTITTDRIAYKAVTTNPKPGDRFKVKFNTSTYQFTVFINDQQVGDVTDSAKKVSMTTNYSGVMLYGGDAYENDIEACEAVYTAPANDTAAPAKINNLSATASSASALNLTWTATGDDASTGTATGYDIRYSKNNITTDAEFNAATQATGVSAPKQSGSAESYTLTGLQAATKYYVAIKARDDAGNLSPLSNIASATTSESGGGGGGGTTSGQLAWKTDDFERTDLGADWSAANYKIDAGELTLTNKTGLWNNIALYQTPGAFGAGAVFSAENSALYNNAYVPAGLLILMDNSVPSAANGYLIKRVASTIDFYRITGGAVSNSVLKSVTGAQTKPLPGDKIEAVITNNGSTKTVRIYVRGQLDGTVELTDALSMENAYVGVALYGGIGFSNNLESFAAGYPGGAGPQTVRVFAGNNQSGPINQQLPLPIQVEVLDENSQPSIGSLLDFQVIQGLARLDDLEDFVFLGQVWKETEQGRILRDNGKLGTDANASGTQYVTYDWVAYQTRFKMVAVPFYLPEAGRFDLWVRCRTLAADKYRFHYSLDDAIDSVQVEMPRTNIGSWVWHRMDNNVPISAGMHDLNLIPYHADLQWDKILVQTTGLAAPTGTGGEGPSFPNMTNENGIGGTKVTFGANANDDVIIYVYAYRDDGSKVEEPAVFTLNPTPGPAVSLARDPSVAEPVTATPGAASPALKVIAKDANANYVEGVSVTWQVTQGDGAMASPTSVTNALGVASNTMNLNFYQETDYKVQAAVNGLTGSPVVFTVKPGAPPKKIVRIQPKKQQKSNVNTRLDSLLTVRILKADDTPFEGYAVKFVVTQGAGHLSTPNGSENVVSLDILTDVQGYARSSWLLGNPGLNMVEAQAPFLEGNPVIFEAIAQTGQAANLLKYDGDGQSGYVGLSLAKPFIAKITDANGFPVSEQEIKFTLKQGQGGYFDQFDVKTKTAYTNNEGQASVTLTLGSVLNEEHVVEAVAVNTTISPAYFRATPTARIAKSMEYVSGNPVGYQKAVVGSKLAEDFVVRAKDPYGTAVAEQPITFKVLQGGGKFDNGLAEVTMNSDAQGLARARLTLGAIAGDSLHVVSATGNRKDQPSVALTGAPITFKATGLPKPAAILARIDSTNAQRGEVGYPLVNPIRVKVTDEYFNPVKNHAVTFKIRGQGGELEDAAGKAAAKVTSTNASGIASVIWHMPSKPGIYYVDVTSTTTQG
ncbi:MAG: hypothetical protein EHM72_08445, partial [Calditrichaeota bacterium]